MPTRSASRQASAAGASEPTLSAANPCYVADTNAGTPLALPRPIQRTEAPTQRQEHTGHM